MEKRRISKYGRISWVSGSQGIILEIIIFSVALNKMTIYLSIYSLDKGCLFVIDHSGLYVETAKSSQVLAQASYSPWDTIQSRAELCGVRSLVRDRHDLRKMMAFNYIIASGPS